MSELSNLERMTMIAQAIVRWGEVMHERTLVRHVRAKTYRPDRRIVRRLSQMTDGGATLCGAAPTVDDWDRATLAHVARHAPGLATVRPEWAAFLAQVCPRCRERAANRRRRAA